MKTTTRTLIGRLGALAAAALLTAFPVRAQWFEEDAYEGTSYEVATLPDGSLITFGNSDNSTAREWVVRWKDPELVGNPELGWRTVDDLRNVPETVFSTCRQMAADASGNVYVVGRVDRNVSTTGKGKRTIREINAAVRKGTYDVNSGQWTWEFVDLDPELNMAEDVGVDPSGRVYVLYSDYSPQQYVVKFSDDGGDTWQISETFDYEPDPNFDLANFAEELAVDAQGNVYVASWPQKVVNYIPGTGKGKKNQPTLETERVLLIRRYDAVSGVWTNIEEYSAAWENRSAIAPHGLIVSSDGLVIYGARLWNSSSDELNGTQSNIWMVRAGIHNELNDSWSWTTVDYLSGHGESPGNIGEGPDGTIFVVGGMGGGTTAFPENGLIRSSLDLVNWSEEIPPAFRPLDIAFKGESTYISGITLADDLVDVLRKDLP